MRSPAIRHEWISNDGKSVTIRPMRPEDRDIEQAFVRGLSQRSRYLRFLSGLKELSPQMLDRLTHTDFPRELALIATVSSGDEEQQIGVARYAQGDAGGTAEFAVVVADAWQGKGLGRALLKHLFSVADEVGIEKIEGIVLLENRNIVKLARELGFSVHPYEDDTTLRTVSKEMNR